jgi:hypothetical protein
VLTTIGERQVGFRSLKDIWADTTTPHGRLMLTVLGRMLLRQVGCSAPSDADIQEAIEAHDVLIERLQAIAARAQALSIAHQL